MPTLVTWGTTKVMESKVTKFQADLPQHRRPNSIEKTIKWTVLEKAQRKSSGSGLGGTRGLHPNNVPNSRWYETAPAIAVERSKIARGRTGRLWRLYRRLIAINFEKTE